MTQPQVVSRAAWRAALSDFREEEKAATRARDALNARRRRLPITAIERDYAFGSPGGALRFVDLFQNRAQLIVYHNMLSPGSDHICRGCSLFADQIGNLAHLAARRTSFAMVSRATVAEIERVKARLGWTFPWYSCHGGSFYEDFVGSLRPASFGLSVFIRKDGQIFQTYFTSGRGVEYVGGAFSLLDLTLWGRQEAWEDSPQGWPREPTHSWERLHDEYGPVKSALA
jgi:predicted dithiol-disulfide oxidoreductase (DUF899 family)